MTPTQTVLSNDRLYNGKELQDGTNWLDYGARMYYPELGRWMAVDPSHEDGGQESSTPYGYVFNNPAGHTDPDGRIPHVVAGAIAGGLIGGAIEAGRQVWNEGKVSNWRAVGGAALQGAITGGVAAATGGVALANGGLSYLATTGAAAGANVVGGAASNAIQGKPINAGTMAKDAAIGAASGIAGKAIAHVVQKVRLDMAVKAATKDPQFAGKSKVVAGKLWNGKIYVGSTGKPLESVATQMQPGVQSLGGIGTKTASGNTVGCCAEQHVGNVILKDNPAAKASDILWSPTITPRTMEVKPMCDNCKAIFQ